MPIQISKTVGLKAHGQKPEDVKTIQTAFAAIKCKRGKPFYQGRIDGKCGPKTLIAIEEFQGQNNIRPTGRIEPLGTTINRIWQKLPAQAKASFEEQQAKQTPTGGSPSSKSSTSDQHDVPTQTLGEAYNPDKIAADNKKLAKDIIDKWPLPKKEAIELARLIELVGTSLGIPLKPFGQAPVNIDNEGRYTIKLDIPYDAYQNNIILRQGMVRMIRDFIGKSLLWSKGDGIGLLFKATHITQNPNNVNPSKDEIVRVLSILSIQNGIPLRTLKTLISAESDFRQFNDKGQPLIAPQSFSSAAGLGQITRTTARLYGENYEKL